MLRNTTLAGSALLIGGIIALSTFAGCSGALPDAGRAEPGKLTLLEVRGGVGPMYPSFASEITHYAVPCNEHDVLTVSARADGRSEITMLHSSATAVGSIVQRVEVGSSIDIAVRVESAQASSTYYVHCTPADFPRITVEHRSAAVSDGLMLMTPGFREPVRKTFLAIVDNNGVPRWSMAQGGANFRRYPDGRYSHSGRDRSIILDSNLQEMAVATVVGDLTHTDSHDFRITEEGNYLMISYNPSVRDLSMFECPNEDGTMRQCSTAEETRDSVIQEVTPDGEEVFRWDSWDHLNLEDCTIHRFPDDYAHLNSLDLIDGDIIAGFRGCAQVLRIDRSSGTGAVEWQIGGSEPRDPATVKMEVVGDPAGEFCGQHSVWLDDAGSLLMFDNGNHCLGPRKHLDPFTRVVEYDISSGTEARYVREYRLPEHYGYANSTGGVTRAPNGNWMVAWGRGPEVSMSEIDVAGNEVLRIRLAHQEGHRAYTARVYRENDVLVPITLPPESN